MDMNTIVSLISTLGFPMVACIVMGWFIFKIYKNQNESNAKLISDVQARCAAREERLNEQIAKSQEVNAKAIATLALYSERLGIVEQDVKEIKEDVNVLVSTIKK